LQRAIGAFGVSALISGIRRDQQTNTKHRAKKDIVGWGRNGELRIHPFIDLPKEAVDLYIDSNKLPRHPLYGLYDSIDDWPLMRLGQIKLECGMHLDGEEMIERAS
jgi:3'-phosphoadenosine 5'-phosphosulfate sulfotransferase (PAPS reductase)/FAD synthetase